MIGEAPVAIAIIAPMLPTRTLQEFIDYATGARRAIELQNVGQQYLSRNSITCLRAAAWTCNASPTRETLPPALPLMSGEIQLLLSTVGHLAPLVQSGKVRALAVTSAGRSTLMPDLPTTREAGMPDFMPNLSTANDAGPPNVTSSIWYALLAPPGVPADVVKRFEPKHPGGPAQSGVHVADGDHGAWSCARPRRGLGPVPGSRGSQVAENRRRYRGQAIGDPGRRAAGTALGGPACYSSLTLTPKR